MMKTPSYFLVGLRPVKADRTPDGKFAMYAYNWQTGDFDVAMEYLTTVYSGTDDVDQVDEQTFDLKVETLRAQRPK